MHYDEESRRMHNISLLAERYSKLCDESDSNDSAVRMAAREKLKRITATMSRVNTFEMAFFCMQFCSHQQDVHRCTMRLTIFANRVKEAVAEDSLNLQAKLAELKRQQAEVEARLTVAPILDGQTI